jgi:hypothetical protein
MKRMACQYEKTMPQAPLGYQSLSRWLTFGSGTSRSNMNRDERSEWVEWGQISILALGPDQDS